MEPDVSVDANSCGGRGAGKEVDFASELTLIMFEALQSPESFDVDLCGPR